MIIRKLQPISSRRPRSSASTCACTITSSAVVGSSATTRDGDPAIAIAIITRWRRPPDSSWGKLAIRRSASGMPTAVSKRAAASSDPLASETWRPTRIVGFSDVIGSWKTAPRCCLRTVRRNWAEPRSMSLPRTATSPPTEACAGSRPSSDRPSTLLPEPDSPTRPRISPRRMSRLTPRTAWMRSPPRRNATDRSDTRATTSSSVWTSGAGDCWVVVSSSMVLTSLVAWGGDPPAPGSRACRR